MEKMERIEPGVGRYRNSRGGAGKVILGIIGGLIALVVLVVLVTVWAVRNYIDIEVTENEDGTSVAISTPFGELSASEADIMPEDLGLPLYPDAEVKDGGGTFRVRGGAGDEVGGITLRGVEFRVRAEFDDVDEWYRKELGEDFERKKDDELELFNERDWPGEIKVDLDGIVYIRERGNRLSGVVLEHRGRRVEISLFEVREDEPL